MGMGWHTLSHPYSELKSQRPCKCGKGFVYTYLTVTEESEYPPFEKGYEEIITNCADNCENI